MYQSFEELSAEIDRRQYQNILGLSAKSTRMKFRYFFEVLPPIPSARGGFLLSEPLTCNQNGALVLWFHKSDGMFICEVVQRNDHISEKQLMEAGFI